MGDGCPVSIARRSLSSSALSLASSLSSRTSMGWEGFSTGSSTSGFLGFCPVSSSCRNWFQDSSVQILSAFSRRLSTCFEVWCREEGAPGLQLKVLLRDSSETSQLLPLRGDFWFGLAGGLCWGPGCLEFADVAQEESTLGASSKVQSSCRSGIFRWICLNILRYQSLGLSTLDRGAIGMPLSSTGPMPSYLTQRLSRRLLSLVHVADHFWECWEAGVFWFPGGRLPGPGQV